MTDTARAELDRALEASLRSAWDGHLARYDEARFPFARWALERVRARGWEVEDLTTIHRDVPLDAVYGLTKALCADTRDPALRGLVEDLVREVIAPAGELEPPLAVQRALNVRIMLPDRPQAVFPFHTGLLYGHGPGSRSVWMPLTDLRAARDETASMYIIGLERSRALVQQAVRERLSVAEMTERFGRESRPLRAGPGEVVLFSQENLHGNVVNRTGKTRVSVDFRIAEARFGDRLAHKPVGGYFALMDRGGPRPERAPTNALPTVSYLHNATPATAGAPVHLQRYMLAEYCAARGITVDFELFELDAMKHLPTLWHAATTLAANVVMYSVFALPEAPEERRRLLEAFLAQRAVVHFVNEDLRLVDAADLADVEALCAFARYGV
ncbi:MAG: hypothetical protein EP329_05460 [Deltaproteobacteria bacterium]|nr:MAG: hypothetical protein EP329_05460 [Deltaproteobacteria bacterium]